MSLSEIGSLITNSNEGAYLTKGHCFDSHMIKHGDIK